MLFSIVGGYVGLAVGGLYGWASFLYSYNRDAWMTDSQIKQSHTYQCDNMQISAHAMSRDEIRDRTQAAIIKLSNYILVTTLILSLAAEMLVEGQVPSECAAFVLNAYMLSLASAILFLVLSILFAVTASNIIYESSAVLLTDKVPPPWKEIEQRMGERERERLTNAFEDRPMKDMFMMPFGSRIRQRVAASFARLRWYFGIHTNRGPAKNGDIGEAAGSVGPWPQRASHPHSVTSAGNGMTSHGLGVVKDHRAADALENGEESDATSIGNGLDTIENDYDRSWEESAQIWMPLMKNSGTCVALGLKCLLESYGYLCMAGLFGDHKSAWAFWGVQIVFFSLNTFILRLFIPERWRAMIVAVGPFSCALAAATPWLWMDRVLVPLGFASHCYQSFRFHKWAKRVADEDDSDDEHDVQVSATSTRSSSWRQLQLAFMPWRTRSAEELDDENDAEVSAPNSMGTRFQERGRQMTGSLRRERDSVKTGDLVKQLMRSGQSVLRCLWSFALLWACYISVFGGGYNNSHSVFWRPQKAAPPWADLVKINTSWPSPYFDPIAVVCPRQHVFFADEFRVFELRGSEVVAYPCDLESRILDVTAECDENRCWPVVLLDEEPPAVVDCSTHQREQVLQVKTVASGFAAPADHGNQTLYIAHRNKIVKYHWSARRGGWAPYWNVAEFEEGVLDAIDVVDTNLLVFSDGLVRVSDIGTGTLCGVWELPRAVRGIGCAMEGASSVILLHKQGLMCAELRGSVCQSMGAVQNCLYAQQQLR
eukprot:TRINITY_DN9895_c0_g1_i1.p1 TRINITY_DN9895_c0_g1~~TRINITY_DN9895_c0_g1_i1.p1  ORF type:complete len:767 (-),score=65.18 TRINITY_DN9895_c0_g1_i1:310-2610(-)